MLENYIVPLPCVKMVDYDDILGIDLDQAAGDVARFIIPFRCRIYSCQLHITETCAGTTQGEVAFDLRPTAGSDTNRGDGDVAYFYMGTTAGGKFLYQHSAKGLVLIPGKEVVVQITVQPVTNPAGHFEPVLLVHPAHETVTNLARMVKSSLKSGAPTPPDEGVTPGDPGVTFVAQTDFGET